MSRPGSRFLIAAGAASATAALLHVGCIIFGAPWYRVLGAGEQMAQMARAGHWYPTVVTSVIAVMLSVWALYALSGAGVIRRLPLLRLALCAITGVYLLRAIAFVPLQSVIPGNSMTFWLTSSGICLAIGLLYAVGLRQAWTIL